MIAEELLGKLRGRRRTGFRAARGRSTGPMRGGRLGFAAEREGPSRVAAERSGRAGFKAERGGRKRALQVRIWRKLWASKRARWVTAALLALVAVLGGGWLWVRDSSLVAVERVTVTGNGGPDAPQIRGALVAAARTMTTLDVHLDRLRTAVAPYAVVRDIHVTTQFPHGMRIRVVEEIPVAVVMVNGRAVPVAADGVLLHDAGAIPSLPVLELGAPPGGPRLTEPDARSGVALLAAAPYAVLAKISQVSRDGVHGFTAQLRGGPAIYFGDSSDVAAKWRAALDVLADPGSRGATYIDVTEPRRPAAGAGSGGSTTSTASSSAAATSTAASSPVTTSTGASAGPATGGQASTTGG